MICGDNYVNMTSVVMTAVLTINVRSHRHCDLVHLRLIVFVCSQIVISDAIVWWRTWVIWWKKVWILCIGIVLLLATLGMWSAQQLHTTQPF